MKKPERNIITRRHFGKMVFSGSVYSMLTLSACRNMRDKSEKMTFVLSSSERSTVGAVLEYLFPSTASSPGAKDVNALAFFAWVYADRNLRPERRKFLRSGIKWTQDKAKKMHGKIFENLSLPEMEKTLRELETFNRGERWLSAMLGYIFEALLSDPAYGGNTNEMGWKWLQHRPGYPRPPQNKIYQV